MSGWLPGLSTLSNLREQASELAHEILRESNSDDPEDLDLEQARKKIQELNDENIRLKEENELLKNSIIAQNRPSNQSESESCGSLKIETFGLTGPNEPENPSFDPLLSPKSFKFENHKLTDELKELKAECAHWREMIKNKEETADCEIQKIKYAHEEEIRKLEEEVDELKATLQSLPEKVGKKTID